MTDPGQPGGSEGQRREEAIGRHGLWARRLNVELVEVRSVINPDTGQFIGEAAAAGGVSGVNPSGYSGNSYGGTVSREELESSFPALRGRTSGSPLQGRG
jgi:hypothetical protein